MSNTRAAEQAICTLIATAWNFPADPRTPVQWPNVNFTPPDSAKGPAEWISVTILWGDGVESTMGLPGSGRARNTMVGVLVVSAFTPKNVALGALMGHLDAIRDAVNRVEVNGVRFGVPSAPKPAEDDRWAMRQVTCGFTVDEVI